MTFVTKVLAIWFRTRPCAIDREPRLLPPVQPRVGDGEYEHVEARPARKAEPEPRQPHPEAEAQRGRHRQPDDVP